MFDYTDGKAMKVIGIKDKSSIGYIRYLNDKNYTELIQELLEGNSIIISEPETGEQLYSGKSLKRIVQEVKNINNADDTNIDDSEAIDCPIDYYEILKTDMARRDFTNMFLEAQCLTMDTKIYVCELLNLKYKIKE